MIREFIFFSNLLCLNLDFYEFIINRVSSPEYTQNPIIQSVFLKADPFNNSYVWFNAKLSSQIYILPVNEYSSAVGFSQTASAKNIYRSGSHEFIMYLSISLGRVLFLRFFSPSRLLV